MRIFSIFILIATLAIFGCANSQGTFHSTVTTTIYLTSNPTGASVYNNHNGQYLGVTPTEYVLTATTWESYNTYTIPIKFTMAGYQDNIQRVSFSPSSSSLSVHAILNSTPPPATTPSIGNVTHLITSDPSGAALYINSDYVGNTPVTHTLFWRSYDNRVELRFERSGYQTNRRMMTANDPRIHVVLQP